jgi:hypothetical protein
VGSIASLFPLKNRSCRYYYSLCGKDNGCTAYTVDPPYEKTQLARIITSYEIIEARVMQPGFTEKSPLFFGSYLLSAKGYLEMSSCPVCR